MNSFQDPAAWEPAPVRPRAWLIRRFVLSAAYRPVHWLWVLLVWGFVLGFAALAEIVTTFSDRAENAAGRFLDRLTARTALPRWCVSRREVQHEGDAAYYRALVDDAVTRRTEQVAQPKPAVPREWTVPVRDYRGAGARYVAERAQAQGWQLRPSDVRKEVSLYWPHPVSPTG
ncbi:hypothetical protein [Streptomyces camelliae]|uniref:Uncharacterized protein n=1 Tax=Streptomyces camelliae TaxID=3004093 RepID=A0ABY7P9F3_9ACTN|nr:hypothetical protein [Streptomyces sp. HUAS 2-6]WBO67190.1 hypothetical protein O1G22_32455 [Streptomyces sp. HUAS 2-6]